MTLEKLKTSLVCLVLALLALLLVEAIQGLRQVREDISRSFARIDTAAESLATYEGELLAMLRDPKTRQGFQVLLRSADDLARTIKKVNLTIDDIRASVNRTDLTINDKLAPIVGLAISRLDASVNDQLVPHAAAVLDRTESAVGAIQLQIEQLGKLSADSILISQRPLLELEKLIADPAINAILANVEKTTESGARTMNNVELKTQQLLRPPKLVYRILREAGSFVWRAFF